MLFYKGRAWHTIRTAWGIKIGLSSIDPRIKFYLPCPPTPAVPALILYTGAGHLHSEQTGYNMHALSLLSPLLIDIHTVTCFTRPRHGDDSGSVEAACCLHVRG